MKVATWNVNGIRARQSQLQEWIEREQPDVVCLQEIKASLDQIPVWLCELEGYWCYWHGAKGYSGVALHVRRALSTERPAFGHPDFDYESRIVTAGRALEPENDQLFTWWAPWRRMRERNIGWRLDYVLASTPIFDRVRSCVVQREFGTSDHGPVIATFDV